MLRRRAAVELLYSQVEYAAGARATLREADPDLTSLPWWPEHTERTRAMLQESERFQRHLGGIIRYWDVMAAQPTR